MAVAIARPKLEGTIAVGDDRRIGFAEFGDPQGRAIFWLHGTPGARRQIPMEARVYAEQAHIRLIGIDRPGIGSSTAYQYDTVSGFAADLRTIADTLGIDKMIVVGLSGGGPYTLACAATMPDRVVAAGVIGGVAPTQGGDAITGGLMGNLGTRVAPLLQVAGTPIGLLASGIIRLIKPVASPVADVVVFARDWGFRLADVKVPVRWWHGDHDHIVPFAHGQHVVSKLPDAELYHLPGESHLAGLGVAEEILTTMNK